MLAISITSGADDAGTSVGVGVFVGSGVAGGTGAIDPGVSGGMGVLMSDVGVAVGAGVGVAVALAMCAKNRMLTSSKLLRVSAIRLSRFGVTWPKRCGWGAR